MSFSHLQSTEDYHAKGWGYEYWIANTDLYCGKLLYFNKGKKCSWHYHEIKDETFFIQEGLFIVLTSENDDIESATRRYMKPGDSLHVTPGLRHQMIALEDSILYEFSTQHFDDDSYRIIKGD